MNEDRIKKIVVIGPESTGKSTLSQALAEHLGTSWTSEYAREYLTGLGRAYVQDDLTEIAKGQLANEEKDLSIASKWLICDTDLYVIKVWSEHKYGNCDRWILDSIAERQYDAYILTDIDMPWQDDALREHPDEKMRQYFFMIYKDIVQNSGLPFIIVSGDEDERMNKAIDFVNTLLK